MATEVEVETTVDTASQELTTSEKLFADLMPAEDTEEVTQKVEETVEEVTEPEPDYLDTEALSGKKVKVKIDGVEKEVLMQDLLKGYQTDQYLTQKGQKLAEEKKMLDEVMASLKAPATEKPDTQADDTEEDDYFKSVVKPRMAKEIKELKAQLSNVLDVIHPIYKQNTLTQLDSRLKSEGFDDFLAKVPDIESHILSMPVEKQAQFNSSDGYALMYKEIKIKELQQQVKTQHEKKPVGDERPKPKLVKIEGSESSPSGNDEYITKYQAAFKKAQSTGDWTEVLSLKNAV